MNGKHEHKTLKIVCWMTWRRNVCHPMTFQVASYEQTISHFPDTDQHANWIRFSIKIEQIVHVKQSANWNNIVRVIFSQLHSKRKIPNQPYSQPMINAHWKWRRRIGNFSISKNIHLNASQLTLPQLMYSTAVSRKKK